MSETIFITGGTGKTGKRVADRLNALNIPMRIGSRKADPAFDWGRPELWPYALQGIAKVYITYQPDLAVPSAIHAITQFVEAARKANIEKLVLLSGRGEKKAKACEDIVATSGMDFSIVQAGWFMQNFSEGFLAEGIYEGKIVLPTVTALEPFVDADDIADAVVQCLINPLHSGKTYELTGPSLLSFEQAIAAIARALHSPIDFQYVSMEEYVSILESLHIPEDFIGLIRYLFTEVLDGRNENVSHDMERVLGRPASDFENYVRKTIAAKIWNHES